MMGNIKYSIYMIILLICALSCKEKTKKDNASQTSAPDTKTEIENTSIKNENVRWKKLVNSKSGSILDIYDEDAIKILETDETLIGHKEIKDYYQNNSLNVTFVETNKVIMANANRGLEYEIGTFTDQEKAKYKYLTIWETAESKPKRVFEFVASVESSNIDLLEINKRRELWIVLCNNNNAEDLINEMYSANTLYYNHKPLVKGRRALIKEYAYMNNEKYALTLKPIIVEKVNNDLIFEIGQCEGSYNGKYIIIWKKNQTGKWEVFIDSNI